MADQAKAFQCSVSFISAIERGLKSIPADQPRKFANWLQLNETAARELVELAKGEKKVIKFVPRDRARASIAADLAQALNRVPLDKLTSLRDALITEDHEDE
jgi:hypothetical protein